MPEKQRGSLDLAHAQAIGKQALNQTDYALQMYKHVVNLEKFDKNAVMSPSSIATALAMTAAGAEGPTLDQFVSHLKHKDADAMHQFHLYVNNAIFRDASQFGGPVIGIATGLWVDERTPLNSKFTKYVKAGYGAETQEADFRLRSGEVCKDVNDWVRSQTRGNSINVFSQNLLYSYTKMLLVNALYFKGTWKEKFDSNLTVPKTFYLLDGGTVSVPMMRSTRKHVIKSFSNWGANSDFSSSFSFNYREDPWSFDEPPPTSLPSADEAQQLPTKEPFDFKVLKLPYKAGGTKDTRSFSMYILLPAKRDGLPELEKNLDAAWLMKELPLITRSEPVGELFLPKFKASFDFQVNGTLQSLGLTLPFSERKADFSAMLVDSNEKPVGCFCYTARASPLALSAVVHEAVVEVNEDGTEAPLAGARLAGLTRYNSMEPLYKVDFVADHPFLYLIREDSTGVIMFIGRVANPNQGAAPLIDLDS